MSDATISRRYRDIDITLHTATALATTLDLRDVIGGVVTFGTMRTSTSTLQMWVSPTSSGTFRRLYKVDGNVADVTLAPSTTDPQAYSLPDDAFAASFVKFVAANTAGTGTVATIMFKG